ncbi:hypothetical protein [Caudoviricetes sp.]|nr:hypothetical protein [Caudoviricetes sp.]UOF82765.1 hypothetical protein [Caudoviricetes sp.]
MSHRWTSAASTPGAGSTCLASTWTSTPSQSMMTALPLTSAITPEISSAGTVTRSFGLKYFT